MMSKEQEPTDERYMNGDYFLSIYLFMNSYQTEMYLIGKFKSMNKVLL